MITAFLVGAPVPPNDLARKIVVGTSLYWVMNEQT